MILNGGFRPSNMKLKLNISVAGSDYDISEEMKKLTLKKEE